MLNNLHPTIAAALAPFVFRPAATDPREGLLIEKDDALEDDDDDRYSISIKDEYGGDVEDPDCEPGICPACSGSGEGMHEGTTCRACKGRGEA